MNHAPNKPTSRLVLILSFFGGSLVSSFFSIFQRILLGADPFALRGFIVPFIFGGISGFLIGLWYNRFKTALNTLQEKHDQLVQEQAEKRQLQEELYQSQKMDAIGQLAGGIAHDFNNLMMIINGSCELALSRLTADEQNRSRIPIIWEAGKRATNLTQQLLAFSRRQVIQPKLIKPGQAIGSFLELLKRMVGENIKLELIDQAGDLNIRIDPGQMEQIVINLVVNAKDAMPNGGIITISLTPADPILSSDKSVSPEGKDSHILISVRDTGCGMSPEIQEHIFEPFFTTKPRDKGTGLGLSTVYGIVRQNEGTIFLSSEPGLGTTFYLKFPADRESLPEPEPAPLTQNTNPVNANILLMDDNKPVREIVSEILRQAGYRVMEPLTLENALRMCADNSVNIDLLITDVVMPEVSGKEFSEACRKIKTNLPTLFISGYPENLLNGDDTLNDQVFFLQKPFSEQELLNRVTAILSENLPSSRISG